MAELVEGVRQGNRALLGQAITLVESTKPQHRLQAQELLAAVLPSGSASPEAAPRSMRVGITGIPGVGKSTFIEALGNLLTSRAEAGTAQQVDGQQVDGQQAGSGPRVAVLAVDPSSQRTGGSIMGDKTRMTDLANNPLAFVRPSPTAGELGGVQARTRETILLCEAAGFDIVLVETVGVGQSETAVADMVDFFLVLLLPGAGDDLQGIKKGILELADMIAVNKADGPDANRAMQTAQSYRQALHLTAPVSPAWTCPVVTCSALTGDGLDNVWSEIERHHQLFSESGELAERRQAQRVRWLRALLSTELSQRLHAHPAVRKLLAELEADVAANRTTPALAVDRVLEVFLG